MSASVDITSGPVARKAVAQRPAERGKANAEYLRRAIHPKSPRRTLERDAVHDPRSPRPRSTSQPGRRTTTKTDRTLPWATSRQTNLPRRWLWKTGPHEARSHPTDSPNEQREVESQDISCGPSQALRLLNIDLNYCKAETSNLRLKERRQFGHF